MFHFGRKRTPASDVDQNRSRSGVGDQNTPDQRQLKAEDAEQHTTGLGISLNDYMEQLEADLAPAISEQVTLSGCEMFELVTLRTVPGRSYDPAEEVEQHLGISTGGEIRFRANTYHNGPGRLGIGRVLKAEIPVSAVQEICRMLDTWLYTRGDEAWSQPADTGKWYLRVRFADGREQVQRGALGGAFLEGIDVAQFVRERVPIDHLYLFDEVI